jgi:hypothetical protein
MRRGGFTAPFLLPGENCLAPRSKGAKKHKMAVGALRKRDLLIISYREHREKRRSLSLIILYPDGYDEVP